ncbi:hypothetical protein CPC08DRAFT_712703 [Agrocybe pediades]|nr:hypothetical protein CPC08DRAFT_712703 [Agrocybe pediades]
MARRTMADKMLEVQTLMWEIRKLQLLRKDEKEYKERIEELNERLLVVVESGDEERMSLLTRVRDERGSRSGRRESAVISPLLPVGLVYICFSVHPEPKE